MSRRCILRSRLLLPALALLLPLFLLGGSMGGSARAAATLSESGGVMTGAVANQTTVLRVYFRDTAERDRLATELGAEEVATTDGFITVLGPPQMLADLRARGLRVEVDDAATREIGTVTWGSDPNTFYGGYNTVEEMQAFLDQMAATYPTLAEKIDIGDSWCKTHPGMCTVPDAWNGYDLWVLHITNRNIAGPKPVYWYDAGIHSREIATPETAMNFIRLLLDGYNSNADSHWLVDYHDIWVMPMLNPDGHHIVESGGQNPVFQRKNADKDDGCSSYPDFGTDLNRNFPFMWGCCGGSSGSACSETYRGPTAGSEEENQAVTAKIRSLIPDQRGPNINDPAPLDAMGVYQSMHSYANLNLYAWGNTTQPSPNNVEMGNIGRHMSATNADPPGNNYQACQPPNCLYVVDGDSIDWGYGELGIPSFTTELSGGTFFPSYSYTQNTIWPENRGMLTYLAKIARTPYLLTHGPDARLVATNPMTVTQGSPSQLTATINFVWTGNSFAQNVGAAEYYIDTPPWAGGTAIPMNGNFNSTTVPVNATIDTTGFPVGRHVIFVRGRGVSPIQSFQTWGPMSAQWLEVTAPNTTVTPALTPTRTNTPITPTQTPVCMSPLCTTTPTRTYTATPTASVTIIPCCGNMTVAVLPACSVSQQGGTNFDALVEVYNNCPFPVAATSSVQLQVSPDSVNWTSFAQAPERTLTIPPAPPPYAIREFFTNQNVPSQYQYYRFYSVIREVSGCREYFTMSQPQPICRQSTTTVTVTPVVSPTVIPTGTQSATVIIPDQPDLVGEMNYTTVCPAPVLRVTTRNIGFPVPNINATTMRLTNSNGDFHDFPVPCCFNVSYSFDCQVGTCVPAGFVYYVPLTLTVDYTNTVQESNESNNTTTLIYPPPVPTPCGATPPPTYTATSTATAVTTVCTVSFSDVGTNNTFYAPIRCLACRGIVSGYSDGTFRPNNQVTRGQLAKLVSNSAGFNNIVSGQTFQDVPSTHPFYVWIERLTARGYMTGYACGGPDEPCVNNRPYFRPFANATRGQTAKIVSNAAQFTEPPVGQTFEDVPPSNTFYPFVQRLASRNVMQGYPCGGPGEPCTTGKPYFRPNNDVTRGQSAKIVANTFFPDCVTP